MCFSSSKLEIKNMLLVKKNLKKKKLNKLCQSNTKLKTTCTLFLTLKNDYSVLGMMVWMVTS